MSTNLRSTIKKQLKGDQEYKERIVPPSWRPHVTTVFLCHGERNGAENKPDGKKREDQHDIGTSSSRKRDFQ
ncbi:hypothetical protein HNY73_022020 [Argiope bruennichi]|uniref:Uncharacterized protein n=1 Tax=Argiope bruennichi TaxID=94029 RepID=A0A8T0E0K3_ARGBR|nr:hypothetical protein HNY73_022020 [Argiope bruennichi]